MFFREDAREFFEPLMAKLDDHFAAMGDGQVTFTFSMRYFNSTAARVLLHLMDSLDAAAGRGRDINIVWCHEADDEDIEEQGEEMAEDLEHASFTMQVVG